MALKDFLALTDSGLSKEYNRAEFDATKARNTLVERLNKAKEQHGYPAPTKGKKMWKVNRNVVELTLPFAIEGQTDTLYIPSERFPAAIDLLIKSIKSGELDKELEAASSNPDNRSRVRAPRAAGSGGSGKGWTEERRQRYHASITARNAAKNK